MAEIKQTLLVVIKGAVEKARLPTVGKAHSGHKCSRTPILCQIWLDPIGLGGSGGNPVMRLSRGGVGTGHVAQYVQF